MKKSSLISKVASVAGLAVGAFALAAVAQSVPGWDSAPSNPPRNNASAPINIGDLGQAKTGLLGLRNFLLNPTGVTGSVTPGQVLTAVDADGTVGWRDAASESTTVAQSVPVARGKCNIGGTNLGYAISCPSNSTMCQVGMSSSNDNEFFTNVKCAEVASLTVSCSSQTGSFSGDIKYADFTLTFGSGTDPRNYIIRPLQTNTVPLASLRGSGHTFPSSDTDGPYENTGPQNTDSFVPYVATGPIPYHFNPGTTGSFGVKITTTSGNMPTPVDVICGPVNL